MISVVIPLYNKEGFIHDCLESILSQTYTDYEIVIVNDGSTDSSASTVAKIDDPRIRLINKSNGGPSSARNRGVREAKGEWVVFLDADDLLLPNALEVFKGLIENNRECDYFVCNYYYSTAGIASLFSSRTYEGQVKNPFFLEAKRELTERPGSSVIRRDLLIQNPFDEKLRRYEDAECQYRIMRDCNVYQSSTPVMISVRDAGSASQVRKDIEEDFIGHLCFSGKSFWEQVALFLLALEGKEGYLEKANEKYRRIYNRIDLRITVLLLRLYWKIGRILARNDNPSVPIESLLNKSHYE